MADASFDRRTTELSALRRLVYGYPAGAWFVIHDRLTNIPSEKEHRWILAEEARGEVAVAAFMRSASTNIGLPHPRHPEKHEGSCRINQDGRIGGRREAGQTDIPWLLKARALSNQTYSCQEPVRWYVDEVVRMRTRSLSRVSALASRD